MGRDLAQQGDEQCTEERPEQRCELELEACSSGARHVPLPSWDVSDQAIHGVASQLLR